MTFIEPFDDELDEDDEEPPFICEFGRVHEVNYETLEIKAVIESIDPNRFHDRWIRQMVSWVGAPGYGPAVAPAVGSEVLITGRQGETLTLFYTSVFNEDFPPPAGCDAGTDVVKTDRSYKLLADGAVEIVSQEHARVEAEAEAELKGETVRVTAGGGAVMLGEAGKVAFLGNSPIAKRALPAPGPTDTPLTIAIRQLLIDLGFAQ